ncbi:MAG TPA: hypothetical protein VKS25_04280 [Solirubrobacteraceae bacterium]|nr:hypothetical protein [Solirubrobacteraceae bacterium]
MSSGPLAAGLLGLVVTNAGPVSVRVVAVEEVAVVVVLALLELVVELALGVVLVVEVVCDLV